MSQWRWLEGADKQKINSTAGTLPKARITTTQFHPHDLRCDTCYRALQRKGKPLPGFGRHEAMVLFKHFSHPGTEHALPCLASKITGDPECQRW